MRYTQEERSWPLRRVIANRVRHWYVGGRCTLEDTLECGHTKYAGFKEAAIGKTRRRCRECWEAAQRVTAEPGA